MERLQLTRDCEAVQIPAGDRITLPKGTEVFITQALGGAYTVQVPAYMAMYRITADDADALGKMPKEAGQGAAALGGGDLEAMVWGRLRTVFDPEIPVNIVDLGLVYAMRITALPDGANRVEVKMTLTAPGCGMGASIAMDAREKLLKLEGVSKASVDLVWDPPWGPEMISPEGREILGLD